MLRIAASTHQKTSRRSMRHGWFTNSNRIRRGSLHQSKLTNGAPKMNSRTLTSISTIALALLLTDCGDSGASAPFSQYRITASGGGDLNAMVGDAFRLSVVKELSDGTTTALSSDATVAWSGPPVVTALPEGSTPAESAWPQPGVTAATMWIRNPSHLTDAEVAGVLYVIDEGAAANPSVAVKATVTDGDAPAGQATAVVPIARFPTGDVDRGHALFTANCASCHGAKGEGGDAPGLNADPDNVAGDSAWSPQMLGLTARSNMDDLGVSLDPSMPKWLVRPSAAGSLLTTQDFSDMYAFLKTQHAEGSTNPL
jgi:mono/diheme cytochrome c family protein